MSITRNSVKSLRNDIDAALAAVGAKHGVSIHAGNARFDSNTVSFKLEAKVVSGAGEVYNAEAEALKALSPEYVGKKITLSGGVKGTVVEFHRRKHKYPFIVETANGKRYKVPAWQVK